MGIVRNNHYAALSSKPTELRISLHETRACVSELSRFAMSLAAGVFMAGSKKRSSLNVAAIGNGRVAALLDDGGRLIWWCFPRLDGDPIFSRLLAGDEEKGFCDVVLDGQISATSSYVRNTGIVETILVAANGSSVKITDFAPRFLRYDRSFHPAQLIRRIEPMSGLPRIVCRFRPTFNYGREATNVSQGSNHIRYTGGSTPIRVTTDLAVSYIVHETPFALTRPVTLVMGSDEPIESSVDALSREFLDRTREFWVAWVRGLAVSYEWQPDVIRAAISLKLCTFEETGAITAALTTSIPEAPNTPRTWDYRQCWLRDAYFVIRALNRLGATQSMEHYLGYITTIIADAESPLRPVYGIVHNDTSDEQIAPDLQGFLGMGPVRVGNLASQQMQHDAYGSVILGAAQMFVDRRLPRMGDASLFRDLEQLGQQARRLYLEPDAGIWEYRGRQRIHTHSATMCWVACDRLARIAVLLGPHRTCSILGAVCRAHTRGNPDESLEREARRIYGRLRSRRTRCKCSAARRTRSRLAGRSSLRENMRYDRARTDAQRTVAALRGGRRFRIARVRVPCLPILVHRRTRLDRPHRSGARTVHGIARPSQRVRNAERRFASSDGRIVGQHPADLFDGRSHQFRHDAFPALGRCLVGTDYAG